jgi:hypothetical protein
LALITGPQFTAVNLRDANDQEIIDEVGMRLMVNSAQHFEQYVQENGVMPHWLGHAEAVEENLLL